MSGLQDHLTEAPESAVVGLAKTGDRDAFAELVRRRQSWIRNLMRRNCGDFALADDLAQQVFLQAWEKIGRLRESGKFGPWLQRIAINTWLQHLRSKDVLLNADPPEDAARSVEHGARLAMDLDEALAALSEPERLCIVLSYHEGMTHQEITDATSMPLGTVKSHIRRGKQHLQSLLSAYRQRKEENSP